MAYNAKIMFVNNEKGGCLKNNEMD